ncbi:cyclic pyranopterin monophosphate synthase MoaC [Stieleria sp. JC731]|nr:cyclic pyranopterin monophosphate synthase MoaC [Stieleria sp. JC731]
MVDVSGKANTRRKATAVASVSMSNVAAETVRSGRGKKGDVLAVARLAAINATKWTAHLIPLCHTIPIESVDVDFSWQETAPGANTLQCSVTCQTTGKTGIEMEAMTGASVAALTVYDMLKSVERGIAIHQVQLLHKSGGASGDYDRGDS